LGVLSHFMDLRGFSKPLGEKFFISSREPPSNFMGALGGSFLHSVPSYGLKLRKYILWDFKIKKRRNY